MIRTLIAPLAIALSLLASPVAGQARADTPTSRYVVVHRGPGGAAWTKSEEYKTLKEAEAAADTLRRLAGHQTRVEKVEAKPAPLAAPLPGVIKIREAVSFELAGKAFDWMAEQDDIAFRYIHNGCFARTHLMVRRLEAMGLKPGKVWAFRGSDTENLEAMGKDGTKASWWYHNAPTLKVIGANGSTETYVIDPSLCDRPMKIQEWKRKMIRPGATVEPHISETRVGEAPVGVNGKRYDGTGYVPQAYPPEQIDASALAVMKECFEKMKK